MDGEIPTFDLGQLVRLENSITNAKSGQPVDPTTLSLSITDPNGAAATYTLAATQITRDGPGEYHKDRSADQVGTWRYRWYSTGTGQAAQRGTFIVEPL